MTVFCAPPDGDVGVALRLSGFLDCQARALGENGFQALAGGPMVATLLSGLITIFVALIGYRLILGTTPSLSDGVARIVRVGVVLALATGWPAFQTLVYRVAVDGPTDLAAIVMPAAGLPNDDLGSRVQQAYDTIRLGSGGAAVPADPAASASTSPTPTTPRSPAATLPGNPLSQPALPQTASWFAISTIGMIGALRVAIGFLLAVAPLAVMGLLFDATLGLFSGWLRALAGSALALLASTIVVAIDLTLVESELAHLQSAEPGVGVVDPQGLTTIVLACSVAMIVAVIMAARMAGAIQITATATSLDPGVSGSTTAVEQQKAMRATMVTGGGTERQVVLPTGQERTRSVTDALAASVRREQGVGGDEGRAMPGRHIEMRGTTQARDEQIPVVGPGSSGRRGQTRRTISATRRDRPA